MHGSGAVGLTSMTDPLLQTGLPPLLIQRLGSLEELARQFQVSINSLGTAFTGEKNKLAAVIDLTDQFAVVTGKMENHVGPTVGKLQNDFNQL